MTLRILYTNFHAGDGGGHTTYLLGLARQLASRHEIHVAAPAGSRLLTECRKLDHVHCLEHDFSAGAGSARAILCLRRYLRQCKIDLIHANGASDHSQAMLARIGLRPRPPIVYTKHNSKPAGSLGNRLRARFGTDAVIAVSAHTRDELRHTPYRHLPVAVIRNGVDLEHFVPPDEAAAVAARARYTADPQDLVLGSNAGTADYKGWMGLIETLALLETDARRRVHLVLAGKPPDRAALSRIQALGLSAQVHFTGLLADVRPALAGIDVGFVLSWAVETISFACREMMAMGKPVWVSDYAGLAENIRPGIDGWVTPARDRRAMAEQLKRLLQTRDPIAAAGRAAREHALAEFGLRRWTDATESLYVDGLSKRGLHSAATSD